MKTFRLLLILTLLINLSACCFIDNTKWLEVDSISPPQGTILQDGDTITITLSFHCPERIQSGHLIGANLRDRNHQLQSIGWKTLNTETPVTLSTQFNSTNMVSPYNLEIYLSCYKSDSTYTRAITRLLDNYYQ